MFSIKILEKKLVGPIKAAFGDFFQFKEKNKFSDTTNLWLKNSGEILLDCLSGFLTLPSSFGVCIKQKIKMDTRH